MVEAKRSSNLGALLLVLVVVLGVWLLNGRDPGTGTSDGPPYLDQGPVSSAAPRDGPSEPASSSPDESDRTVHVDPASGLVLVDLDDLPPQARSTIDLVFAGGPFPYEEDGSRFGNYEGLLPVHEPGYYAEYTVETPGSRDRGARRLVAGAGGEFYWTDDHYASFRRVSL